MRTGLSLLLLAGCLPGPDESPTGVFDYVWSEFDVMYGGFDARGVDWDGVYDTHRPNVDDNMSDDALWDELGSLIAELDDGHVKISRPDHPVFQSNRVYRDRVDDDTFDLGVVIDHYLTDLHHEDERYAWGVLPDGQLYLWWKWLSSDLVTLDDALDAYPDAPGIVIDLRHNGGGDHTWAWSAFGRLTDVERTAYRVRDRIGQERTDFGDWFEWTLPPRGRHSDAPVTVLTDAWTVSAAERAIMYLQTLPQTTTLGVPSNGAMATMVGREAPNGWHFSVSVQEVEHADGRMYEGVGLPVAVELLNDPAVLATGTDEMLEAAMERVP